MSRITTWKIGPCQVLRADFSQQVVVHNLPWSITWQELKDIFSHTPGVVRADVIIDATGRSRYLPLLSQERL